MQLRFRKEVSLLVSICFTLRDLFDLKPGDTTRNIFFPTVRKTGNTSRLLFTFNTQKMKLYEAFLTNHEHFCGLQFPQVDAPGHEHSLGNAHVTYCGLKAWNHHAPVLLVTSHLNASATQALTSKKGFKLDI